MLSQAVPSFGSRMFIGAGAKEALGDVGAWGEDDPELASLCPCEGSEMG